MYVLRGWKIHEDTYVFLDVIWHPHASMEMGGNQCGASIDVEWL